ncbi:uracil-DNA glycosylase [Evansella sp. AB-rgal1]|uniref:uracil-DNA glycosylase n=1 Tax=Evansella sp. AB-rgal1 TaxID=3242696 RepID=UPI00359D7299
MLSSDWSEILQKEFEKDYFKELEGFLIKEYEAKTIFPKQQDIFNALSRTSYENTKVVILGQDPYHGPGQAHGLSFSVQPGVPIPRSLANIYKELEEDVGCLIPNHGNLLTWADQGVLLLNTVLTVEAHQANSHKGIGWENFTDKVIEVLNSRKTPIVFILWGKHAQEKKKLITNNHHFIIESAHPSPLSARRGFFGSKPFTKANTFLKNAGMQEIDWENPDGK